MTVEYLNQPSLPRPIYVPFWRPLMVPWATNENEQVYRAGHPHWALSGLVAARCMRLIKIETWISPLFAPDEDAERLSLIQGRYGAIGAIPGLQAISATWSTLIFRPKKGRDSSSLVL